MAFSPIQSSFCSFSVLRSLSHHPSQADMRSLENNKGRADFTAEEDAYIFAARVNCTMKWDTMASALNTFSSTTRTYESMRKRWESKLRYSKEVPADIRAILKSLFISCQNDRSTFRAQLQIPVKDCKRFMEEVRMWAVLRNDEDRVFEVTQDHIERCRNYQREYFKGGKKVYSEEYKGEDFSAFLDRYTLERVENPAEWGQEWSGGSMYEQVSGDLYCDVPAAAVQQEVLQEEEETGDNGVPWVWEPQVQIPEADSSCGGSAVEAVWNVDGHDPQEYCAGEGGAPGDTQGEEIQGGQAPGWEAPGWEAQGEAQGEAPGWEAQGEAPGGGAPGGDTQGLSDFCEMMEDCSVDNMVDNVETMLEDMTDAEFMRQLDACMRWADHSGI